ncbi:hypothetical protein [Azospirillum sp.]|uniref:hypothetical protein n=1 Tax=Azospirillum sp. TaxID=34012 RepID=UPI003D740129
MPDTLPETLLLAPGSRARLIGLPKSLAPLFEPLPPGVHLNENGAEPAGWLMLFAKDRPALDAFATVAVSEVAYDGVLWIAHREDHLPADVVRQALEPFGFDAVAAAPLTDAWTALRFRPKERAAPEI